MPSSRGELLAVPAGDLAPARDVPVDALQLRQADGGLDVGHSVVEADHRKPVAALQVLALAAKLAHGRGELVVVADHHPALAAW